MRVRELTTDIRLYDLRFTDLTLADSFSFRPGQFVDLSVLGVGEGPFGAQQLNNFEITPRGNGVTLEDEMMKVTANQMEYQAVSTLYTRSLRLIRTALGK